MKNVLFLLKTERTFWSTQYFLLCFTGHSRSWDSHSHRTQALNFWTWDKRLSEAGSLGSEPPSKAPASWRVRFYWPQRPWYAKPGACEPLGRLPKPLPSVLSQVITPQTQADLGEAVPELPLGLVVWRLLWLVVQGQGVQVEVLPGWAPVRFLQLGQRLVLERAGVGVHAGPHPRGVGGPGAPRVGTGADIAFLLITEETATSPGTVFFLQLEGFKNENN